jgi:hypothetical protein
VIVMVVIGVIVMVVGERQALHAVATAGRAHQATSTFLIRSSSPASTARSAAPHGQRSA